jgi:ABC-type nitrate/sulfonate/bicarbonate transport system permease component
MSSSSSEWLRHQLLVRGLQLGVLAAGIVLWIWARRPGGVSPIILPKIDEVWHELTLMVRSSEFYDALRVTLIEVGISLFVAATIAFLIAFWAARSDLRTRVVEPLLVWGYLVPHVLFYPVIILWMGIGMSSKIAYAVSAAVFPIAFNCLRAFRSVDPSLVQLGQAYGASPRQIDWQIKFRASVPLAAAGLRIGAALTMVTVIVAEMLTSSNGLGYLLKFYSQSFNQAKSYAVIVIILVVAGSLHLLFNRLLPSGAADRSQRSTTAA